jgi:hypothetical protein
MENYQILGQGSFEFRRLLVLLKEIFPEIQIFPESFLAFQHRTAKLIEIHFTGERS